MVKKYRVVCGLMLPLLMGFGAYKPIKNREPRKPGNRIRKVDYQGSNVHLKKTASADSLKHYFDKPPADCRPNVFWDWMGGMITKEGIRKDLEALAA
jgi:hypothetical protein